MATISENLQIIKNSIEDIKQTIIDNGGTINGDITTYANAIESLVLEKSLPTEVVLSDEPNENNKKLYNFIINLVEGNFVQNRIQIIDGYVVFGLNPPGYQLYSNGVCIETLVTGGAE